MLNSVPNHEPYRRTAVSVTRFAPSPTGTLHIGGARTALFNWLYARHHGGRFRLRIENTDRARSTKAAIRAILDGLEWLGLDWDDVPIYQSTRAKRHAEVANRLLAKGNAYHCFCTPEELADMRAQAKAAGRSARYDGRWRDRGSAEAPEGIDPVVRFKSPQAGETVIDDRIQGQVRFANVELDDMVLLRADGTPTYMLAVVVDDHDMGISDIIRGDDHLVNAARQFQLFRALDWPLPTFAHLPLIHGADGAKLSKRHGALSVEAYSDAGFLPEAMRNYLLRLGWSHGDDEIIPTDQAIAWFGLEAVGRAPARFDHDKLLNLNGHYLRETGIDHLAALVAARLQNDLGPLEPAARERLHKGMTGLAPRAKNLVELSDKARFYVSERPLSLDHKAARQLDSGGRELVTRLADRLNGLKTWNADTVEKIVRGFAESEGVGLGKVAQPLRAALTGSTISPGIFEILAVLGREESLGRMEDVKN